MPLPPPQQGNPMMAALQASRGQAPVGGSPPPPGAMPPPQGGADMAKMASDIQDVSAKLDKLISAIEGAFTGKSSESVEDETSSSDDDKGGAAPTMDDRAKGA